MERYHFSPEELAELGKKEIEREGGQKKENRFLEFERISEDLSDFERIDFLN